MIETGCTIEHEGRTYESGGAVVTDDRVIVYVGRPLTDWRQSIPLAEWSRGYGKIPAWFVARYEATDWHGTPVGELIQTGQWRVPGGWVSGWLHSYRLVLSDGRAYNVRGSGQGMSATGRRIASQRGLQRVTAEIENGARN